MAEQKKTKNNGDEKKKEGIITEKKKKENNDNNNIGTVHVLKADLDCEGCVAKVIKCIRNFDGVEKVSIGDGQTNITVVGKVDLVKLRQRLEKKAHKKVDIIVNSPLKKDNKDQKAAGKEKDDHNNNGGNDDGKQEKMKKDIMKPDNNSNSKNNIIKTKEKELPVTTAVLKIPLHCKCQGCIQKIAKVITNTKGFQDMKIDEEKVLVTVTGAMDMNALAKLLKKNLKKIVEVLPPKKEVDTKKENNGSGGGDQKGKGGGDDKGKVGGGGDNKKGGEGGGGGDKKKGGGGGGGGGGGEMALVGGGEKVQGNKSQFQVRHPYPELYGSGCIVEEIHYNPCAFGSYHAPQIFSDENPNACVVM